MGTESVRLMPSPRLMLTPTFCMVDTTDTVLAMLDTTDIPMPTELPTTERDLLMLSLRLMLILIFFMVDMDMDTLDTVDTMDTHMLMDMLTTESALPMPSPRLMLTLTFFTEIWIWTPWIPWILRIPIWWICLLRISYDTKAISCYRKLTKLPSMSSSSVTTFFSAWTQFWVVQQEAKRIKI